MVNAWSLLGSELNGTMDEDYPIMSKDDVTIVGGGGTDTIEIKGVGAYGDYIPVPFSSDSIGAADTISFSFDTNSSDTLNIGTHLPGGAGEDHLVFNTGYAGTAYAYDDPNDSKYYAFGDDPYPTVGSVDSFKPQPNLNYKSQKYEEDKGIKDLKDYVSSTYNGHYTNDRSDVQTLDLIHSVGDAESFCRSNALKYLSRYDKKGSAKRDILKAMHYCLLLYYFSGNTNDETPTRGYETF